MRHFAYKHSNVGKARSFRKKMTEAEQKLWSRFRNDQLGVHFRRQVPIGSYIVDFMAIAVRLVVEADGSQHYSTRGIRDDKRKDDFLHSEGLTVLRFSNADILGNIDNVIDQIYEYMQSKQLNKLSP